MVDTTGLARPMRDDIKHAGLVVDGDAAPTVEGGADIGSICETILELAHDRARFRAERDALKAAIDELAPETAKLRAALEVASTERAIAIAERDALKADAGVGRLVRALPVGWWLEIDTLPECEYHVEVGKWGNPSSSTMDDLAAALCVAYQDAGIEAPNA